MTYSCGTSVIKDLGRGVVGIGCSRLPSLWKAHAQPVRILELGYQQKRRAVYDWLRQQWWMDEWGDVTE